MGRTESVLSPPFLAMSVLCAPHCNHVNAEGLHGVGMTGTKAVMGKAQIFYGADTVPPSQAN